MVHIAYLLFFILSNPSNEFEVTPQVYSAGFTIFLKLLLEVMLRFHQLSAVYAPDVDFIRSDHDAMARFACEVTFSFNHAIMAAFGGSQFDAQPRAWLEVDATDVFDHSNFIFVEHIVTRF